MTYLIRNLDAELWRRFRTRCARERLSAQAVLMQFVEHYAGPRYHVRAAGFRVPHYLTSHAGTLTADRTHAETYASLEAAQQAISAAQAVLDRVDHLVVTEAE